MEQNRQHTSMAREAGINEESRQSDRITAIRTLAKEAKGRRFTIICAQSLPSLFSEGVAVSMAEIIERLAIQVQKSVSVHPIRHFRSPYTRGCGFSTSSGCVQS